MRGSVERSTIVGDTPVTSSREGGGGGPWRPPATSPWTSRGVGATTSCGTFLRTSSPGCNPRSGRAGGRRSSPWPNHQPMLPGAAPVDDGDAARPPRPCGRPGGRVQPAANRHPWRARSISWSKASEGEPTLVGAASVGTGAGSTRVQPGSRGEVETSSRRMRCAARTGVTRHRPIQAGDRRREEAQRLLSYERSRASRARSGRTAADGRVPCSARARCRRWPPPC